jgi:hypothetical protein
VSTGAKARHAAAAKAAQAADALQAWLDRQPRTAERAHGAASSALDAAGSPPATDTPHTEPAAAGRAATKLRPADRPDTGIADLTANRSASAGGDRDLRHAPQRLGHPDWLYHRLRIIGPEADLAAFRAAAAGAGTIPWQLDLDRMEEDLFHLLVAPPAPAGAARSPPPRRLSLRGARILAGQLRDAAGRRHELAAGRVGLSRACPFDLHALVPVPEAVLWHGPDDPRGPAWLWHHWGTTEALRHVAVDLEADDVVRGRREPGEAVFAVSFWSADWTPWRALARITADWPALRFEMRPNYDMP